MKDKNGTEISVGDSVVVPDPIGSDIHNHSFIGYVCDIFDDGNVCVEDGDSDFFTIEPERLEVIDN
jgi:hypothetical protein